MHDQDAFFEAVARCASEMNAISHDWMLFGGAAMALYGVSNAIVQDIDIAVPQDAVKRLAEKHMLDNQAHGPSKRFRSRILVRPDFWNIPVEIMGDFEIYHQGAWVAVDATRYQQVSILEQTVNLASRQYLKAIFELCGREKDLLRARQLT